MCYSTMTQKEKIDAMSFTFSVLHYQQRDVRSVLLFSVTRLQELYALTEDPKLLELARLEVLSYLNMGFSLPDELKDRDWLDIDGLCASIRLFHIGKRVRPTKAQVRSMIGRWSSSRLTAMTVGQVVEDILQKVSAGQTGMWCYIYRKTLGKGRIKEERYELIVGEKESFFWDMNMFRFYVFEQDGRREYAG